MYSDSRISIHKSPNTVWEQRAPIAKRDLIIKKVVVTFLALLNFAALGVAIYYIISYTPVPTQAILISPFIVGVLAALTYLKFPTFGVSSQNYSQFTNPASLIGRGLAYLFFGPLMYAIDKADWTPYHDPIRANKISNDLETLPFDKLAEEYGEHFDNLARYGFIPDRNSATLVEFYEEGYKPLKKEVGFWESEGLKGCAEYKAAEEKIKRCDEIWEEFKETFEFEFPHPPKPIYDFKSVKTTVELKARSLCCFGPPIAMFRGL